MRWKTGLIVRIKNYKFDDDHSTRNKYAIVLYANDQEAYIIHSLTTSKNNPGVPGSQFGCSVYQHIPYFFIPKGQIIGDEDFSFESDTYIFFSNNVRKESFSKFDAASKHLFGLIQLGVLRNEELKRIIKCALKSRFIALNIAQELTAVKEVL